MMKDARLAASAGIVTWVATGGNPGNLLGLGGGRSLKRQDMAEKEACPELSHMFSLNSNSSRSHVALLLLVASLFSDISA